MSKDFLANNFLKKTLSVLWYNRFLRFLNSNFFIQQRPRIDKKSLPDSPVWRDFYRYVTSSRNDDRLDITRLYFLYLLVLRQDRDSIPGDIAELGVYKGNTAAFFRRFSARRLHLFDTFEGFDKRDSEGLPNAFKDTDLRRVQRRVGIVNTFYYAGYFPETAASLGEETRFSLVHIDTDIYPPIAAGLRFFHPRLAPGGAFVVHDYNHANWGNGAKRAVDEFLVGNRYVCTDLPDTYGSIMLTKVAAG